MRLWVVDERGHMEDWVRGPTPRPHNVKLCRGRFQKMQVGGRAVPKGTTRRGRPPATVDGRRHQLPLGFARAALAIKLQRALVSGEDEERNAFVELE